jgi:hypothetical protein
MDAAPKRGPGRETGRRQYGRSAGAMPIPSVVMGRAFYLDELMSALVAGQSFNWTIFLVHMQELSMTMHEFPSGPAFTAVVLARRRKFLQIRGL